MRHRVHGNTALFMPTQTKLIADRTHPSPLPLPSRHGRGEGKNVGAENQGWRVTLRWISDLIFQISE